MEADRITSIVKLTCALCLAAGLVGCGEQSSDQQEVVVFAAASLGEAVREVGDLYTQEYGVKVVYNLAGSNTLAEQIMSSNSADVYLSANASWVDRVEENGRLVPDTRYRFLSNQLVVVSHPDSGYTLPDPKDLPGLGFRHLAIGDPDAVPAGKYAKQWLSGLGPGVWPGVEGRVVPAADVREALGYAESKTDVVAIVYRTDAINSGRVKILYEVPSSEGPAIGYTAAQVRGPNTQAAVSFIDFLRTEKAQSVFTRHGFLPR